MDKIKIQNKKTGAIEEVKKEVAGDFIGTNEWVIYEKKENKENKETPKPIFNKEDK